MSKQKPELVRILEADSRDGRKVVVSRFKDGHLTICITRPLVDGDKVRRRVTASASSRRVKEWVQTDMTVTEEVARTLHNLLNRLFKKK